MALLLFLVAATVVAVPRAGSVGDASVASQARWVIRDLGTWPGGKQSWAVAVNERSQVVVLSETAQTVVVLDKRFPVTRAFLWEKGTMRDLGAAFGGPGSSASAINDRGQVVGQADVKAIARNGHHVTHAFFWQNGKARDLGTLGVGQSTYATALNERGQVVGASCEDVGSVCRAFLWEDGKTTDLGTLGGALTEAADINDRGQVAGTARTGAPGPNRSPIRHAFVWQNEKLTDLGTLGGPRSHAAAINDRGQVVGDASTTEKAKRSGWLNGMATAHAFLWQNGTMRDLGTLGGEFSRALAINERGLVIGTAAVETGSFHGFLWQSGRMRDLGTFGGDSSEPTSINDRGQVVGWAATTATDKNGEHVWHASLWRNGSLTDLGTLGGKSRAVGINERGQIIGWSETKSGNVHAVLWTLRRGA